MEIKESESSRVNRLLLGLIFFEDFGMESESEEDRNGEEDEVAPIESK